MRRMGSHYANATGLNHTSPMIICWEALRLPGSLVCSKTDIHFSACVPPPAPTQFLHFTPNFTISNSFPLQLQILSLNMNVYCKNTSVPNLVPGLHTPGPHHQSAHLCLICNHSKLVIIQFVVRVILCFNIYDGFSVILALILKFFLLRFGICHVVHVF